MAKLAVATLNPVTGKGTSTDTYPDGAAGSKQTAAPKPQPGGGGK